MIRAVEIAVPGESSLSFPMRHIYPLLGPAYALHPRSGTDVARRQLRLELSWPRMRLEIIGAGAHVWLASRAYDITDSTRVSIKPVLYEPAFAPRDDVGAEDLRIGRVHIAIVFACEGHGVDMAYVFRSSDPALRLLIDQLHQRGKSYDLEFSWIPRANYRATPMRQAIHEYDPGRRWPGPDLVVGGIGPTLKDIFRAYEANIFGRANLAKFI